MFVVPLGGVGDGVDVRVGVRVGVGVCPLGVFVRVGVGVFVRVGVAVGVLVAVGVFVAGCGVAVGNCCGGSDSYGSGC
jgi:hypothetical protein